MATESWVIRLSRVDQDNQPILVHVSRKSNGHALDLDLLATDGESAYRTKVRERKLEKLRAPGYDGTPEEWSSILQYVLHPSTSASDNPSERLRDTLSVTCAISGQDKKSSLNIIIRQSVEGITHKFGSLQLPFNDDTDDVDLFGWATEIADERDSLAARLRSSNTRAEDAEKTIKSLEEQLQALITAKEEHETQLLSKFALLLNEKKLRIRSQQRLIADQQAYPLSTPTRKLKGAKGTQKRKAADHETSDQGSESEGFDAMDVEQDDAVKADDSDGGRTTAAETDSESDPEPTAPPTIGLCKPFFQRRRCNSSAKRATIRNQSIVVKRPPSGNVSEGYNFRQRRYCIRGQWVIMSCNPSLCNHRELPTLSSLACPECSELV